MDPSQYRETSDLDFAAYAMVQGLRIVKAEEIHHGTENNFRYCFTFECEQPAWDQMYIDYTNSQFSRYANEVRNLKKLCKRNVRRSSPTRGSTTVRKVAG